jgi:hypothetical protein
MTPETPAQTTAATIALVVVVCLAWVACFWVGPALMGG